MMSAISNPSPSAIVVMLRGINNVGSKRVTMAALKSAFEAMGFTQVRTVLASGNVVCVPPRRGIPMARTIARGLEKALGFPVVAIIRTMRELRALIDSEPFQGIRSGPGVQRYLTFLIEKGKPRSPAELPAPPKGVRVVRVDAGEIYSLVDLSRGGRTPDLMRYLDRNIGPEGTTRNWRTVLKIVGTKA